MATYTHANGYSAKLYGISSMSIFYHGKEISHTGFRNVNTEEEVMDLLEKYPALRKALQSSLSSLFNETSDTI